MENRLTVRRMDVRTARLRTHVRTTGPDDGTPVLLVHGNVSSSVFWEDLMGRMPASYLCIAPDLRGYGDTEDRLVDATRGVADWVDDLLALLDSLDLNRVHVVGHSLGGVVSFGLVAAASSRLESVTLVATGPPCGFGGVHPDGSPLTPDFAGSGAGLLSPAFVRRLAAGDRGLDDPASSPREIMRQRYFRPPFIPASEEALLDGMLSTRCGDGRYPGDVLPSPHAPGFAPGPRGPVNAISGFGCRGLTDAFLAATPRPPVLWVRGAHDVIVADQPTQPMVDQIRTALEAWGARGGSWRELALETGHTPYLEAPEAFLEALLSNLDAR
ncbi:MAG: alpha/beta hydrolase [Alphaproteobacteria bacterium]|nr:alpha/beta hydrolase [Alphaproteobacteria bacterium]